MPLTIRLEIFHRRYFELTINWNTWKATCDIHLFMYHIAFSTFPIYVQFIIFVDRKGGPGGH